jgi:hypothetical protein
LTPADILGHNRTPNDVHSLTAALRERTRRSDIYLLSGWLQSHYPGVDWFAHDSGHLLEMLFGWKTTPHFGPFHLLSYAVIGGGFWLLASSWKVLYAAQRAHVLATSGPYARLRHPQYAAFVLIMVGFLVQRPNPADARDVSGANLYVRAPGAA